MEVTIKDRKEWVDVLRGLAIVLVVYGHQVQEWNNYFVFTSAIKIPLFFFISGYLFKSNRSFLMFLRKLTLNVIVPYFFLVLTPSLIYIPIQGFEQFFYTVEHMINGESYWFMPCLIIGEVLFYIIIDIFKQTKFIVPSVLIVSATGYILWEHNLLNYGMINIALEVQTFLLMGYLFKNYEDKLEVYFQSWGKIIILLFLYILLCALSIFLFPGKSIDCHTSDYFNIPYCVILIALGCTALSLLSKKIGHFPKLFVFIGQNSLVLYLCASLCKGLFFKVISIIGFPFVLTPVTAIFLTIWTIALCGLMSLLLNKYCPFLVGKKRV